MSQDNIKAALQAELTKEAPDFGKIGNLTEQLLSTDKSAMRFSVDAKHIHRLGFELVGKQETAISELIKNAYDADASLVHLEVSNFDKAGGQLIIRDDGSGMSEDDIRTKWMKLSTSDKEDNPVSPWYGRSRAGRKGIGRFAAERLGTQLILESRLANKATGTRVIFEWDKNYKHGTSLANIANKIERFPKDINEHGTTLIIDNLRDKWKDKDFQKIWKSLLLLQSPFTAKKRYRKKNDDQQFESDSGFQIQINEKSNTQAAAEISIENSFLQHRTALIRGKIDAHGIASYTLNSKVLDFKDSHTLNQKFLATGELEFEANYFIYDSKLISGFSVRAASKMGHSHGGMRIYRDGFRVMPYGENYDDWLNLAFDTARRNLLAPLNNFNLFGHVEVTSEENGLFEETASREGFIENEAFEELYAFLRKGLEWAGLRIASHRGRKQKAGQRDFISSVRKPSELLKDVIEDVKQQESVAGEEGLDTAVKRLEQAQADIKYFEKSVDAQIKEHIEYEALLRILASLGISISVFSHEIRGAVTQVRASLVELKKSIASEQALRPKTDGLFDAMTQSTQRLEDLAAYIIEQISHTGSREKTIVAVSAVISTFIKQFENYLNTRGIQFEFNVEPKYLRTQPIHRSEIDSVLFNFLTNAIKAMERDNIEHQAIKIDAFQRDDYAVIRFQDTGKGVNPKIADYIFDAFYTTSDQHRDEIAGPGSGLGLKIVADIASTNNGFARLAIPDKGYGGCFEFGIPVSPKQKRNS